MLGFFQDSKGNKSSGRLNSSLVVWTGLGLCLLGAGLLIFKPESAGLAMGTGITLITLGLGAKTLQNNTESKNGEIK